MRASADDETDAATPEASSMQIAATTDAQPKPGMAGSPERKPVRQRLQASAVKVQQEDVYLSAIRVAMTKSQPTDEPEWKRSAKAAREARLGQGSESPLQASPKQAMSPLSLSEKPAPPSAESPTSPLNVAVDTVMKGLGSILMHDHVHDHTNATQPRGPRLSA